MRIALLPLLTSSLLGSALCSATLAAPAAVRQAEGVVTPWHIATMKGVSQAAISPDGRHVAYSVSVPREPGLEDDGPARSELHMLDTETGESRAFITAKSGASRMAWTPDGSALTFVAKREGDDQRSLYRIPADGGEATKLFSFEDRGVGSYEFSADGSHVAMLATPPQPKQQKADAKKGYRPEVYEENGRNSELWVWKADGSSDARLIELDGHITALHWSPDNQHVAVSAAPNSLVDESYTDKRIWIVNAVEGKLHKKLENRGKLGDYAWKPDGSGLAMIAAFDEHDGSDARLLWGDVEAGGEPTPMLGQRTRDENEVTWIGDDTLLVLGSDSCWSTLDAYRFDGGKAVDRESFLPLEGPVWTAMSVSADGKHAALVGSTPEHPPELYTLDLTSKILVRRTDHNPWLQEVRLAKQEVVRYSARDGMEIEGVLINPLEASGPVPLIMVVHGGPEAHLSNGWLTRYSYPGQIAAAKGYAVFYPNYRGSTGRGLAYLKASQGDPAGKEFDDVVDAVDHFVQTGLADKDRIGVTGGSYGGYATAWMSTYYSDRFAAGVMAVGISNKISKVGTTDIPDEEYLVHAMKRPWDDWMFFLERSPIFYAGQGKTPLLILHGKEDTRVDPGQSRELYRHLKIRGSAPVRLVNYPGEGHGNRNAGARYDWCLRMLRWFDHYLMADGGQPPAWPLDYAAHTPGGDE